jgi:hypothetical protein
MIENLTKNPTNDTSKKNLSSLVFTATGNLDQHRDFKALFMGDASAHSIFGDGPSWDGVPIDFDVMKGDKAPLCDIRSQTHHSNNNSYSPWQLSQ